MLQSTQQKRILGIMHCSFIQGSNNIYMWDLPCTIGEFSVDVYNIIQ